MRPLKEELKKVFKYQKRTGKLFWKRCPPWHKCPPRWVLTGKEAGCINGSGHWIICWKGAIYRRAELILAIEDGEFKGSIRKVKYKDGDRLNDSYKNLIDGNKNVEDKPSGKPKPLQPREYRSNRYN